MLDYRRTSSKADLYDETNFFLFILSAVNIFFFQSIADAHDRIGGSGKKWHVSSPISFQLLMLLV